MKRGIPLLLVLALLGCPSSHFTVLTWNKPVADDQTRDFESFVQAQLDSILAADPVADAEQRMATGDSSYLALAGYAWTVPGLPRGEDFRLSPDSLHLIVPQCEVYYFEVQIRFCAAAHAYAKAYNTTIRRHRRLPASPADSLPPN